MPQRTLSELNALDVICEYTAVQSLCVKLFCGKQEERRGTEGGRVMVNYVPCTVQLRYSAACVHRGVMINRKMKMASCHSFLHTDCTFVTFLATELDEAGLCAKAQTPCS